MATSCRRSRSSIDGSGASESDFAILSTSSVAERSETSASSRLRLSNASESCSLRFSALRSSSSRRKPDAFAASRALRSWFLCVNSTNSSLSFSHRTRSRRSSCRFWSETDSLRSNSRILSLHSSSFAVRSRSARSLSCCTDSKWFSTSRIDPTSFSHFSSYSSSKRCFVSASKLRSRSSASARSSFRDTLASASAMASFARDSACLASPSRRVASAMADDAARSRSRARALASSTSLNESSRMRRSRSSSAACSVRIARMFSS